MLIHSILPVVGLVAPATIATSDPDRDFLARLCIAIRQIDDRCATCMPETLRRRSCQKFSPANVTSIFDRSAVWLSDSGSPLPSSSPHEINRRGDSISGLGSKDEMKRFTILHLVYGRLSPRTSVTLVLLFLIGSESAQGRRSPANSRRRLFWRI